MGDLSLARAQNYLVLWAKSLPRHPLMEHMLDAAAVSLVLPPLRSPGVERLNAEAHQLEERIAGNVSELLWVGDGKSDA